MESEIQKAIETAKKNGLNPKEICEVIIDSLNGIEYQYVINPDGTLGIKKIKTNHSESTTFPLTERS